MTIIHSICIMCCWRSTFRCKLAPRRFWRTWRNCKKEWYLLVTCKFVVIFTLPFLLSCSFQLYIQLSFVFYVMKNVRYMCPFCIYCQSECCCKAVNCVTCHFVVMVLYPSLCSNVLFISHVDRIGIYLLWWSMMHMLYLVRIFV